MERGGALRGTSTIPKVEKQQPFSCRFNDLLGEGDSKIENCNVRLTNTDPMMIKIFSRFLRMVCKIPREKIRVAMILYPDLKEDVCKKFWCDASEIPENQFIKTQIIKGKHPTRRLNNGICIVYVSSRQLKEKIYTWIKLSQEMLTRV